MQTGRKCPTRKTWFDHNGLAPTSRELHQRKKLKVKRLISLLTIAVVLTGCATGPDKAALQARKQALANITRMEIFYNGKDELAVVDGGGSSITGLGGLLGPIGLLAAVGADADSKHTLAEGLARLPAQITGSN
jgi:hypothetical protein